MKFVFTGLFVLLTTFVNAQTITGNVVDASTTSPVAGATGQRPESAAGTIMDTLGRGQPIFGAVAGVTNLTSTPISLNPGAGNNFFNDRKVLPAVNAQTMPNERTIP